MKTITTDLVIIGAGLAGLCAALTAQDKSRRILLLAKDDIFASGSSFRNLNGRWGITYAVNDEEKEHLCTTINTIAKSTNNQNLSQILVEESHQAFRRLQDWGVLFTHHPDGNLLRENPCFADRPLAAIIQSTTQCAEALCSHLDRNVITYLSQAQAHSIETNQTGFTSVIVRHQGNALRIKAQAAILATGGNSATFQHHITEPGLTGDGYNILQKLGVPLKNMQFTQMAWEEIEYSSLPRFSMGAFFDGEHIFKNMQGEVISLPDSDSSLAKARRQHVPISNLQDDRLFDNLLRQHITTEDAALSPIIVQRKGTQIKHQIIPQAMASNGGVEISGWGETGIDGLFAAGEITTGMHGGDRVGGAMIASCMVFGHRAALQAIRYI